MSKLTRALVVVAGVALCGGVPLLLAGYEDEALHLPAQWDLDYRDQSIQQIVDRLGPPQESLPWKQMLNWTRPTRGGVQVLMVFCPRHCDGSERAAEVVYHFYRERGDRPFRSTPLLKAPLALKGSTPRPGSAPPSAAR